MNFALLCERARQLARESVRKGEFSERRLARLTGVSQSHIHNVLKGARSLSIKLADQLLHALKVKASDLMDESAAAERAYREIPLMLDVLGSCEEFRPYLTVGQAAVPEHLTHAVNRPIAAHLGEDCMLPAPFAPGDLVVVQQAAELCSIINPYAVYVVLTARGPRLRHMRGGTDRLFAAAEPFLTRPSAWERATSIYGRVAWVSARQLPAFESTSSQTYTATPAFGRLTAFDRVH